jgi:hypothetical protein
MANGINLDYKVTVDQVADFLEAIKNMTRKEVLAGFPADEAPREDADGNPEPITNAALGYIHNFGSPEQNIPARPFMIPGIEAVEEKIGNYMHQAGVAALDGNQQQMDGALLATALTAQAGIQAKINDGPFEPLAESTLRGRAQRGQAGAQKELDERAMGQEPGIENARPLIDTGQLRNAVQGIVRET